PTTDRLAGPRRRHAADAHPRRDTAGVEAGRGRAASAASGRDVGETRPPVRGTSAAGAAGQSTPRPGRTAPPRHAGVVSQEAARVGGLIHGAGGNFRRSKTASI